MKRQIIYIILACFSIIIIIASILYLNPNIIDKNRYYKDLEIKIKNDVRVNEEISLKVDNVPDRANVSWKTNNQVYYGRFINITFTYSDYHVIDVVAVWDNNYGNKTLTIPVKNLNITNKWSGAGITDLRLFSGQGWGEGVLIDKGIFIPTVSMDIHVENIYGKFSILCVIFYENTDEGELIFEEDISGFNRDVNYIREISNNLPNPQYIGYDVSVVVHCDQGHCGSWSVQVSASY